MPEHTSGEHTLKKKTGIFGNGNVIKMILVTIQILVIFGMMIWNASAINANVNAKIDALDKRVTSLTEEVKDLKHEMYTPAWKAQQNGKP